MNYKNTLDFARDQDKKDPLKATREQFYIPKISGKDALYFTGNSLGLQPKITKTYVEDELTAWQELGVEGHFEGKRPWFHYHKYSKEVMSSIVGAQPSEVVAMNSLTTNLHLLMVSFYRPSGKRYKIITEAGAFPSDQYALESQVRLNGFEPNDAIVEIAPRPGEATLRTEDIIEAIAYHGNSVALVMMSGVQYYTGQFFNIKTITEAGHQAGAIVGFDLAHAAGNVLLNLHNDEVDFAVWCTYKYMNAGPGSIAGAFVHEKHGNNRNLPRFAGWWGHNEEERFQMKKGFNPMPGADGWQLSNVNVLTSAALLAALDVFASVGMNALREKSLSLTGYFEFLINELNQKSDIAIRIITPAEPEQRGCQLSLVLAEDGRHIFDTLTKAGVIVDWREPNLDEGQEGIIRAAPTPLYNTFTDVFRLVETLEQAITLKL